MWYKIKRVLVWQNWEEKQIYPAMEWNWDLTKLWTPKTFTISSPIVYWYSICFNPDWTKFYVSWYQGNSTNWCVQQYSCSTPWDITTASLSYSISLWGTSYSWNYPTIQLGNDWKYLYFNDYPASWQWLKVYQLSTAWDINSINTTPIATTSWWPYIILWIAEDGKAFIHDNDSNALKYVTSNTAWSFPWWWTNIFSERCYWARLSKDWKYFYKLLTNWYIYKYSLSTDFDPTSTKTQVQTATISSWYWLTFDTYWNNLYSFNNGRILYQYPIS